MVPKPDKTVVMVELKGNEFEEAGLANEREGRVFVAVEGRRQGKAKSGKEVRVVKG